MRLASLAAIVVSRLFRSSSPGDSGSRGDSEDVISFAADQHVFPKEIWLRIALELGGDDLPSLFRLSQTCKYVHRVCTSNVLWLHLYQRRFLTRQLSREEQLEAGGMWLSSAALLEQPCVACSKVPDAASMLMLVRRG